MRPHAMVGARPRFRDLLGAETRRFVRERRAIGVTGVVIGVRGADANRWTRSFFATSLGIHPTWARAAVELDSEELGVRVDGAPRPVFVPVDPGRHRVAVVAEDGSTLASSEFDVSDGEVAAASIHPRRWPLVQPFGRARVSVRHSVRR